MRMAMMAITTRSSIRVKAFLRRFLRISKLLRDVLIDTESQNQPKTNLVLYSPTVNLFPVFSYSYSLPFRVSVFLTIISARITFLRLSLFPVTKVSYVFGSELLYHHRNRLPQQQTSYRYRLRKNWRRCSGSLPAHAGQKCFLSHG